VSLRLTEADIEKLLKVLKGEKRMTIYTIAAAIPLPLPVFLIIATFIYQMLKYYFPSLPFTQEQLQFLMTSLLGLLGIVVTAGLRVQGLI
jgi:hypothetical protein